MGEDRAGGSLGVRDDGSDADAAVARAGDSESGDLGDGRRVVYYLDADRRPVGVLLWKVEDAVDAAREVLAAPPADPEQLRGRIG